MYKKKIWQLITRVFAVVVTVIIAACALMQKENPDRMEKLLKDSGFKVQSADTPEKLAQLRQLPQRKLVTHQQGNKVLYIYADADRCECVYTGGKEAYQRYQSIAEESQIAEKDRVVESRDKPARMDWGDWRFSDSW